MNHVSVKKNKDDVILNFEICNNCDFEYILDVKKCVIFINYKLFFNLFIFYY